MSSFIFSKFGTGGITLLNLFIFSVAMGYLETAVVVYLRELYYPTGFQFPLHGMKPQIVITELLREAATVIMLYMVAHLTAKTNVKRFAYFIFCFAVWDIFYYVFLKLLLNWPASIFDWDILFLIPLPWVGPVLAPVLISCSMILWALLIEFLPSSEKTIITQKQKWIFTTGSLIVILSFIMDYILAIIHGEEVNRFGLSHLPEHYNWLMFSVGYAAMLYAILIQNNFLFNIIPSISFRKNNHTSSAS